MELKKVKIYRVKHSSLIVPGKDGIAISVKVRFRKGKSVGDFSFFIIDQYRKKLAGTIITINSVKKKKYNFTVNVPRGNLGIHTWANMRLIVESEKKLMKRIKSVDPVIINI